MLRLVEAPPSSGIMDGACRRPAPRHETPCSARVLGGALETGINSSKLSSSTADESGKRCQLTLIQTSLRSWKTLE